ncbi:MAG: DNA-directed RNA polymerase sigma-70 factor [Cryomorphaceae bacterium]|nr:MAG: DNA-directed RNA polymerase sigma-70 factor [Cryomorphaceae bacterium]
MGLKQSHRKRDSLLVQNAMAGDQKAYSELMSLYWNSIEKTLSLKLVSREDVEDLTIATFSKAFDKLDSYDDSFAFSTWIQTIASNTLIDFFRKKDQKTISIDQQQEDDEINNIDVIDNSLDPENHLIRVQKNKHITGVVHRLKPHYRELIILRYLDEMSYVEISKKLNMPLGSVKAKLFRARDLLMHILKNNENDY